MRDHTHPERNYTQKRPLCKVWVVALTGATLTQCWGHNATQPLWKFMSQDLLEVDGLRSTAPAPETSHVELNAHIRQRS